jgi:hypothetical protein
MTVFIDVIIGIAILAAFSFGWLAPVSANVWGFAAVIVLAVLLCFGINFTFEYFGIGPDWIRAALAAIMPGALFLPAWHFLAGRRAVPSR